MTTRVLKEDRNIHINISSLVGQANLLFWFSFLFLNALIFAPYYLLNLEGNTIFPWLSHDESSFQDLARQIFVWRNNLDVFRLNAEITLLICFWIFLPFQKTRRRKTIFLVLTTILFTLIFVYAVYESLSLYIYQVDPVFFAHYQLIIDGWAFLLEHLQIAPVTFLLFGVGIVLGSIVIVLLIILLVKTASRELNYLTKTFVLGLSFLVIFAFWSNVSLLTSPKSVVNSLVVKLHKNTTESIKLSKKVNAIEELKIQNVYDYSGQSLISSPNVFLIFVESYGSILYKKDEFKEIYHQILKDKETELQNGGWFEASTLSEAPTWGGGSWLSYTSTLFGLRIDNHPQYLAILDKFQDLEPSDWGATMKSLGYQYIRVTSLAVELSDQDWQKYVDFYGVDKWIRYRDLEYHGVHYGWGPSPPDQYVLNSAYDLVKTQSDQPFFLFLITQNSHYPWRKIPELADDWHELNDGNEVVAIFKNDFVSRKERQDAYLNSISYELDFLVDFILKQGDDNDIFVLIGDHQPGYVTRRDDGFQTPVHIISKDQGFVEAYFNYGFVEGLEVNDLHSEIKHEGLYSLFMEVFLNHFGLGTKTVPPYLPEGITVDPEQNNAVQE